MLIQGTAKEGALLGKKLGQFDQSCKKRRGCKDVFASYWERVKCTSALCEFSIVTVGGWTGDTTGTLCAGKSFM